MRCVITGASGLLGRPVHQALIQLQESYPQLELFPWAFSRSSQGLHKVDLCDQKSLKKALDEQHPELILHTAAERRPDVSEKDPQGTQQLNVEATDTIAQWCEENNSKLIYLSTDYVFDGSQAPYGLHDQPNPLNAYGLSKWEGEKVVLNACRSAWILRVPILYGPSSWWGESAVTILMNLLEKAQDSSEPIPVEAWATRYPTCTLDIADLLSQWCEAILLDKKLPHFGPQHFTGCDAHTKYSMACCLAETLQLKHDALRPDPQPPAGAPRPKNAQLDDRELMSHFPIQKRNLARGFIDSFEVQKPSGA